MLVHEAVLRIGALPQIVILDQTTDGLVRQLQENIYKTGEEAISLTLSPPLSLHLDWWYKWHLTQSTDRLTTINTLFNTLLHSAS